MTKPELFPTVIFRLPRFSYNATATETWEELKKCIQIASPAFYETIETMSYEELQSAELKIKLTAAKYFNRAKFRSTPFALFSSVGVTKMNYSYRQVQVSADINVHAFTDWQHKPPVPSTIRKLDSKTTLFIVNSTFYCVGSEIRFVQSSGHDRQIAAIDYDETIMSILDACSIPLTLPQIMAATKLARQHAGQYIMDLLNVGLLFTSTHPNIIGKDYFARIGVPTLENNKKYLIAECRVENGGINQRNFRHLPDLVLLMHKIMETNEEGDLKEFKERFSKKFELAEIPLMLALDPEAGIGYGGLEYRNEQALMTLLADGIDKVAEPGTTNELQQKIIKAICKTAISGDDIDLDQLTGDSSQQTRLPNTFTAVCTLVDADIYLDALGGNSATALSGRFALAIPEIHNYCKEIAAIEQSCNPDVLLFDVGYTKEDPVDNINRRPAIYDLQLNILNYDTSANPLKVNDILISVQNGQVMLRSRSLDKRLIPRFASAYNYKRSDLPLFRLLMDIQSQGIQTNLTLRPAMLIRGLPHYPRVRFRNIIVSPATWVLDNTILKGVSSLEKKCNILSKHLNKISCRYVRTGEADQTQLLDVTDINDLNIMVSLLERNSQLYLEEAFLPRTPAFTDTDGNAFLPQVIVTLINREKQWDGIPLPLSQSSSLDKKVWVAPGGQWLYFEIYGNPFFLNELLFDKIKSFLHEKRTLINRWFFIRYNEGGDHIRLRLKLKDKSLAYSIVGSLTELLGPDLDGGRVTDIRLCTYKKEIHRYSAAMMESVEEHFYSDSRYVISMLGAMLPDFAKYRLCIVMLNHVYESNVVSDSGMVKVLAKVSKSLQQEHHFTRTGLKRINIMLSEFRRTDVPSLSARAMKLHGILKDSMIGVLEKCPVHSRSRLLIDLMHMHINRLFVTEQRLHELIIYEFYIAERQMRKHLVTASAKPETI